MTKIKEIVRKLLKITKSLKFKLTIWYSVALSIFCISFFVVVNIGVSHYMSKWEYNAKNLSFWGINVDRPVLNNLSEDQINLIVESRARDIGNIRILSLYSLAPLILLSFISGYILASIMLEPLNQLNVAIKKKEVENIYEEIPYEDNGDEISELIKSFNRMSNRLGKSFDSQKQFVENASHELKTPLSVIVANLDTVLDDEDMSAEERRSFLLSSKKQVQFLNSLTEDLLLMTIDKEIKMGNVEILSLLRKIVQSSNSKKFKVSLVTKFNKDEKIYLSGNEILLERAIMNIVENSVKYSEGSKLDIVVEKGKERVIIKLRDDGKGIPEESKEKIFERFYRTDKGRSRSTGGKGLGLSITRRVIELHNGKVYLNKELEKGSEFVIELSIKK